MSIIIPAITFIIGVVAGFAICAILCASSRADEQAERYLADHVEPGGKPIAPIKDRHGYEY